MTIPIKRRWENGRGAAAVLMALGFGAALLASTPAEARVFIGFGFGFPIGFPYYYPPYPYPYYPVPYYPPVPYSYPPPYYPAPTSYQPSAYPTSGSAAAQITYTLRPGWIDARGQYCREYKSMKGIGNRATERYGTACRDASGQWHFVN